MKQNTPEWEEWRKDKIGASDAPIIMGVSPWKTPYKLWMEKVGLSDESSPSYRMTRGTEMEEHARHKFISMSGISVFPSLVTSIQFDWMIASLDGISLDGNHAVEIKCPGETDHHLAQCGIVPEKYIPQLQHQISVTGLDKIFYFSYDGENGVILEVSRDQEYIDKMIDKEIEFYTFMMKLEPPEMTEKDFINRYDDAWMSTAIEYRMIKLQLNEMIRKENELREKIILLSKNQNSIGAGIKVQKIAKKGLIDYSKIPELYNIDLEKYRKKSTTYWKIGDFNES